MTRAAYNGTETLTFSDYLDLGTGRTLTAEPGQVYDLAPAGGRGVPDVPVPWFSALGDEPAAVLPMAEPADEPPPEPEAGEQQPEDGPQQF